MTPFQALAFAIAAQLHPGADRWAKDVVLATVEGVGADETLLATMLVWEREESDFGRALSGKRWDSRAYGILQIRDKPWLEKDVAGSVRVWLSMYREGARQCGAGRALNMISSGHCDWADKLVARRLEKVRVALAAAKAQPE